MLISLEKRYIFTLSDLDAVAPMHNHFLEELDTQLNLSPGCVPVPLPNVDKKVLISMSQVPLGNLPQYFNYERCKELVLYEIVRQTSQ